MRRLKPIKGHPRTPRSSAFTDALDRWVRQQSTRFDVSYSMVIATCVSSASGIKEEDYRQDETTPRKVAKFHLLRRA